ncbi:MAG: DUF6950 family protein [Hyphomicrobiaceae bacterium]
MAAADVIARAIEQAEGRPMTWGRDDCAMWAAAILRALYGIDLGRGWRCRYRSKAGAARVLGRRGLLPAVARTARRHGWRRIPVREAQPGDLGVYVTRAEGPACAISLDGPASWVGRIDMGVVLIKGPPGYAWRAPTCPR